MGAPNQSLLRYALNDSREEFKQRLEITDKYHEALDVLEEYHGTLEYVLQMMPRISLFIGPETLRHLQEMYGKVMKERRNE